MRCAWLKKGILTTVCSPHAPRSRCGVLRHCAGLGGEPDYQQRFTAAAKDLDKLFKTAGNTGHVYTLTGAQATAGQLKRHLPLLRVTRR